MVKKQTVWLLTMLSLVVVLSVYYVITPDSSNSNVATSKLGQKTDEKSKTTDKKETSNKSGGTAVETTGDDVFAQLRMDMEDNREEVKEKLQNIIGSATASAQEKSEAADKFQQINDASTKEKLIETLIKSRGEYKDALVRADENKVRVTVKADKHSKTEANKIIQLVRGEVGTKPVDVQFEPTK
ncbi:SpoIIIAH-like family protein [Microbacteriaceae bacterium 4G12]